MTEKQFLDDLEKKLWTSANKLLPALDAALYKHVILGMVFLKYVSDSFNTRASELKIAFNDPDNEYYLGDDAEPNFIEEELENRDYYTEKNIFWIPQSSRWDYLKDNASLAFGAKLPDGSEFKGAGKLLDDAMDLIEKENPKLKRILNKNYAQLQIEQSKLSELINLISTIPFTHDTLKSKDILGHVYEYFLGQFAAAEGKKGGQFYTPKSIVNLIIEMVEPFSGRIYDPAMGSGGFFISSEKFIESHSGKIKDISVYGQESNHTTWKLAAMNMAIRGIDFDFGKEPAGTFTNDQHLDLKADFVLANPPFNQDEWWDASLENDVRWKDFGTPPKGNGNFAWMMHMIHHTSPDGVVGLVLANGSLSSTTGGEGDIREAIVKADLVEAIVALPSQLFSNTQIPASIWILNKNKAQKGKTLFIDAREYGYMISRNQRAFDDIKDIKTIADTFHNFRTNMNYEDIQGQFFSASINDIAKHEYILTPGRYIGVAEEKDDGVSFKDKMESLTITLKEQFEESDKLEEQIKNNLLGLGYEF
ncbi:MAG: SAM-dependent DNA methyltransferase [Epsilonproteobacteria bacterium]|nr:MAG: SAM-dependent DNA methyltransferase [Campylobacterota bacterium]